MVFYLFELEMGARFQGGKVNTSERADTAMVLEVESSRHAVSAGHKQVTDYLGNEQFTEGYIVAPFVSRDSYKEVGLLTISPEGGLYMRRCPLDYSDKGPRLSATFQEVERLIKLAL